jgi:4-hydroxy-2-oxoheptanedioate aldolase
MQIPVNRFKQALAAGRSQIGLWLALADPTAAEAVAGTGFDWLVVDCEHVPNDLRSVLAQLQALASYPVQAVVRPPIGDVVVIKQLLEIGVQTLLIPVVESAGQAARMVAATRYPPRGVRGVGNSIARSSRWGRVEGYALAADEQMCVLVQVETVAGLEQLAAIAGVEGVDGVFFGPADLAASMGLLGESTHADVRRAIEAGIVTVRAAGKAAGVLAADVALARSYLDQGAQFVAVGADVSLMVKACRELAGAFGRTAQ